MSEGTDADYIKTSTHTVSVTDVGIDNKMRPAVLLDLIQDIAADYAARIGIGVEHLAQKGLAWFAAAYHIIIHKYPRWQQELTIRSWLSGQKKLYALRDIEITDKDNDLLISVSSGWLVIDIEKRRPKRPDRALGPIPDIDKRTIDISFDPLPEPQTTDTEKTFEPLFSQIDQNNHVNSTAYLTWAIETMPTNILQTKQLTEIEIAYKNETLHGQHITAKTQLINDRDELTAIHLITNNETKTEAARLRTKWK